MPTKEAILKSCEILVAKRVADIQEAMAASHEAANNETKSSAGDKYETTRAMMHFELEKLSGQLNEAEKLREALFQIAEAPCTSTINLGNVITTNTATYFLGIGLGKINVENESVFAISTASPIGQLLLGKSFGDEIVFNNTTQQILSVY
jgi:transcription elongation GreA/GreB family factor